MIYSHWLATLLGGSLAIHGALGAITLNVDDESQSLRSPLTLPALLLATSLARERDPDWFAHNALL
jgi:hypothetical protein